jgi:hypothetical protein
MTNSPLLTELAADLVRRYCLTADDLVIEVGSGEGTLLKAIRGLGPRVLGVEADVEAMMRAWAAGVDSIAAVFGPGVADYARRRYGPARLLLGRSVRVGGEEFARLVAAGSRCLVPDGVIVVHSAGANAVIEVRPDPTPAERFTALPRAA